MMRIIMGNIMVDGKIMGNTFKKNSYCKYHRDITGNIQNDGWTYWGIYMGVS